MASNMTRGVEHRLVAGTPLSGVRLVRRGERRDDDEEKPAEQAEAPADAEESEGEDVEAEESEDDDEGKETSGDSPGTIEGYAAVFHSDADPGTEYELWDDAYGRAVERVAAGAFRDAITRPDDVRGLYNHEPGQLLGRTSSGTMRLEEDERGLRYEIDLPDTQLGRDVASLVERGDLNGSSFGFVVDSQEWSESKSDDGTVTVVRTIRGVRLLDVGPVTYPAYASTTAGAAGRSVGGVRVLESVAEARAAYEAFRRSKTPLGARIAQARARAAAAAAACDE